MKLTSDKTEAVYRRYAIVCEADLTEGLKKLDVQEALLREKMQPCRTATGFSHSLATVPAKNMQITQERLAEGARFETPDDTETIGPDLTASVLSQSFTKAGGR